MGIAFQSAKRRLRAALCYVLESHLKNPAFPCKTKDCCQRRHLQQKHRLDRCWFKGKQGDAVNAIAAAAGYNLRWLMRWIAFLCA
ncbi:MAG TPA: hypothetical protein ACQGQI_08495 [Xylella sp.]